jgi:DNA-binding NarL/FixJ family response regulator
MQDSVFEILFLGENSAWAQLCQALRAAPDASLRVQRLESLDDLFHSLAVGCWHALLVDVHAWNFQGLHYVEKVRSEYPAFPIVALFASGVPDLDKKAIISGASRCLRIDQLTTDALYSAVASTLADTKSQFILQRGTQSPLPLRDPDGVITFSKNQVITHALNNLLCVIAANADILSDKLSASATGSRADLRPLSEIKKAAQSAAALMRHLK